MKYLITGGAGFIGSAVVRYIINYTQDDVLNIDKLTYAGNLESLAEIENSPRYAFKQIDICDAAALQQAVDLFQPDVVMHLAAESHVDRSIDGPATFIQTNIVGTYTLLEAVRKYWLTLDDAKKQDFRFHHISTDEVYGDLEGTEDLFTETTAYAPSSPYSASKASSDHLVRAWNRTYGLPAIVTNCSNNFYGNGQQIRDWLYVEDHARALYRVASQGKIGETYNIGGHNEKQNIEVVKAICALLDEFRPREDRQPYASLITYVADRPGHDLRYAIDASKIANELNWMPEETFETGLRKTVVWYLNNLQWCRRVQDGSYQRERLGVQL